MWTVPPPTHAAIQLSTDLCGREPFHWWTRGSASTPRRQNSRRHSRISSGTKSFSVYQGPFSSTTTEAPACASDHAMGPPPAPLPTMQTSTVSSAP
jgi:hypothetical protein